MGYTHYFYRPVVLDKTKFAAAITDCQRVMDEVARRGIMLTGGTGKGCPKVSKTSITFNGNPDHETFHISNVFDGCDLRPYEPMKFSFCKTARKPYDLAVMGCLLAFKHHFGSDFTVASDGTLNDWKPGFDLVKEVLGYTETFEMIDNRIVVAA